MVTQNVEYLVFLHSKVMNGVDEFGDDETYIFHDGSVDDGSGWQTTYILVVLLFVW